MANRKYCESWSGEIPEKSADAEESLKTSFLVPTGSHTEENKGTRLNLFNTNGCPDKRKPVIGSFPIHTCGGTGLRSLPVNEPEKEIKMLGRGPTTKPS